MSKNTEKSSGASGGDYPVDPAERVSQEARLRKAAAAGANFPKSPIPALMPRSGPIPAPQPVLSQAAFTEAKPVHAPEIYANQTAPVLQSTPHNGEILVELKKIVAWAELQRNITKWSFIVLAVFIPAAIGFGIIMEQRLQTNIESTASPQNSDWYDVERNVRSGNFEKAIAIGESLIQKTPMYPEAHQRLAGAYLAAGNLEKAKEHYAEAFRLFPSEQNEKLLDAIEKRVNADKP